MIRRMDSTCLKVAMIIGIFALRATAGAQSSVPLRSALRTGETRSDRALRLVGLNFGLYSVAAQGLSITGADVDGEFKTKLGEGAGLMIGVGVTPLITLFTSLDLARQQSDAPDYKGSFGLAHFEVGARVNMPLVGSSTVPYVSASVGRRAVGARVQYVPDDEEVDMTLSGRMYSLGGGVQHFLSPHMTLDAGAEFGFGKFDHYEDADQKAPLDVTASRSLRLRVGVNLHP
jgi:hypothetical protein